MAKAPKGWDYEDWVKVKNYCEEHGLDVNEFKD